MDDIFAAFEDPRAYFIIEDRFVHFKDEFPRCTFIREDHEDDVAGGLVSGVKN